MQGMLKTVLYILLLLLCLMTTAQGATIKYEIRGIEGEMLANVQKRLTALQETTPPLKTQEFIKQAPREIQLALQPYGYFHATVRTQGATFIVNPGKPLYITQVNASVTGEGRESPVLQNFLSQFPIHVGEIFNAEKYEKSKQAFFNLALKKGYLTPTFTQQKIMIDLKKNRCTIVLILDTGPLFYFGPVSFSATPLSLHLLNRFVPFQEGEHYSSGKIAKLQSNLNQSGYFKYASVMPQINPTASHKVPIKIDLAMQKKQHTEFGLGFGTDTGPRVSAKNQWRYINAEGHKVTAGILLSSVQNVLQASYIIPGKNPATDQYNLNTSLTTIKIPNGSSRTEQIGIAKNNTFDKHWQQSLSLNYQIEQFKFEDQPGQTTSLLIPGVLWSYLKSNDPLFPTVGNRFSLDIRGSPRNPLSDTSFWQTEVQDKFIYHFTENDRIILRGDVGYTAVKDLTVFPLSLRFYAGGAQSVRGFSYESLGPGRYLLTSSAEWQQRIHGKWYGALFADAGNASDHLSTSLERSAGVGIVWASPVGVMELTVARVISLPDHPFRIQFVLGPDL